MTDPLLNEILPEERLAKVFKVLFPEVAANVAEIAAKISPYVEIETRDAAHEARIQGLYDFYSLREKLMQRERECVQRKSELFLKIASRPEAAALGLHIP